MRRRGAIGTMMMTLGLAMAAPVVAEAPARADVPSARPFTIQQNVSLNDPLNKGAIARQLRTYIQHTPRGATISIMSFYISSSITWPALREAYQRGVNIRVVLYGGDNGHALTPLSWEGAKLQTMIDQGRKSGRTGSWVVWTKDSGRGNAPEGNMHAKMWQFSRVGATKKVTMIGSYNNGDGPDGRAYAAMATMTNAKLYDRAQSIFNATAQDRYVGGNPQRRYKGTNWDLYAMPSAPITKANDPVMKRLSAIPANADTRIKVSMYSWQGYRGAWLAKKLASMVTRGTRLTVVVGPDVAPSVVKTLRTAGANMQDGCWRTGRNDFPYAYTHHKEMSATWVSKGKRRYAAWFGSDDWGNGPGGSMSDQLSLGIHQKWAWTRLEKVLSGQIAHRPDKFEHCDPI
ncbi:MAG: phospholipase D-like domain-containing protein [Nocardioides sp.]